MALSLWPFASLMRVIQLLVPVIVLDVQISLNYKNRRGDVKGYGKSKFPDDGLKRSKTP